MTINVLLDADLVCYRSAASAENESLDIAIARVNDLTNHILERVEHLSGQPTTPRLFLSGVSSFRKTLNPSYKANRVQERPRWLEACREHCVSAYGASVAEEIEADDALSIQLCKDSNRRTGSRVDGNQSRTSVLASLDKDLLQVPGWHYSWQISGTSPSGTPWVREEALSFVTPLEGLRTLYKQILIGDVSDNVKGALGIGKAKASKLINPLEDELEMEDVCRYYYNDDERLKQTCQMLYILRTENDEWIFRSMRTHDLVAEQSCLLSQEAMPDLG